MSKKFQSDDDIELDDFGEEGEPIINIDISALNIDSKKTAEKMVGDLNILYGDTDLLQQYPSTKARLDIEIETLRGLLKMRSTDEQVHDALLTAIAMCPSQASLYRALTDVQKTSLSVTCKINDTIETINRIIKSFQLELNKETGKIDSNNNNTWSEEGVHMGSKQFIMEMNKELPEVNDFTDVELP